MKLRRFSLLTQLLSILIYYLMTLFSIIIQPFNLIFGFIIVLILPGYNLLKILKPDYGFIEKLGYAILLSLAIENIFMLFSYIILNNYTTHPETPSRGFIFNSTLLITAILFVNVFLIIINEYKYFKSKKEFDKINERKSILNLNKIKKILNVKVITILAFFGLSLIFLCISTTFSNVPNNDYLSNYSDYRSNFTFFYRVPLIFYLFLITSILFLAIIIFYIKKPYIILISISIFIYCLWILPYLQINNYFNNDSYYLLNAYEAYLDNGIQPEHGYGLVIFNYDALRYSTSLFNVILLTSATNMGIDFVLWYLYPLFYVFLPFFFYSVFKKYSRNKQNEKLILMISVIFSLFTPQFLKYGHAPGTGVFGIIIYIILVVEFYNLMQENNFNINNSFLIILLYFLLCLTHTEECIYFLILIILFSFYYFFKFRIIANNKISHIENSVDKSEEESLTILKIIKNDIRQEELKNTLCKITLLLILLSLIFYFTLELFGWINNYFFLTFARFEFFNFIYDLYLRYQIKIPFFLRGGESFNYLIIVSIIIGYISFSFLLYLSFFKKINFHIKINNFLIRSFKNAYNFIRKIVSSITFQIIFFPLSFSTIILINLIFLGALEETFLLTIITLFLSYFLSIIQIFLFTKGISYYKIENNKQNFYIIAIIASSVVTGTLVLIGKVGIAVYVFHTRLMTLFVFFNLIIIQNTYMSDLINKIYNYLIYIIIIVLLLSIFYSLRTLAYG